MSFFQLMNVLTLIFLVLVAGCTSQHSAFTETLNPIPSVMEKPETLSLKSIITVNPISDHYLGEVIRINGTIKCDKGEIFIYISDLLHHHTCLNRGDSMEGPCTCCEGVSLTAPITQGIDGNNSWSVELNTSEHNFTQGNFSLWAIDRSCGESPEEYVFLNISAPPADQTSFDTTGNPV